ncbi:hypothetical protein T492DRAFT_860777 [Pavlovales sp. CCMP2436]|nr:hypothetical protein T492DRAFT_860777 [Pavlovales sp. CCMP2436]
MALADRESALLLAAAHADTETLRALLDAVADDALGRSALSYAAAAGRADNLALLLHPPAPVGALADPSTLRTRTDALHSHTPQPAPT